jgi:hypothetical protein
MRALGEPLASRAGFRPRLGVKCGFNDAFIVRENDTGGVVGRDGHSARIEPGILRPLVRGEGVTQWSLGRHHEHIVFPHDSALQPLTELPPLAAAWLGRWRKELRGRSDLRGRTPWWSLFRTEAAASRRPRVVWADLSRSPRAAVIGAADPVVPLNSCYVVFTECLEEAQALTVWLNSPLAAAWLSALAEPARGGFRRMFGWTVGLLPLPRDWDNAVAALAPLGARAMQGDVPERSELEDAAEAALGLAPSDVESLLTWGHR